MTEVTREQHLAAFKRAVDAGDAEAANAIGNILSSMDADAPKGLGEKLKENLGAEWDEAKEAMDTLSGTIQGAYLKPAAAASAAIEMAGEAATTTLGHAGRVVWDALPEYIRDPVTRGVKKTIEAIEAPELSMALEMAAKGAEVYGQWAQQNPQAAEAANSALNIGAVMFPRVLPTKVRGDEVFVPDKVPGVSGNFKARTATLLRPDVRDTKVPGKWDETSMTKLRGAKYKPVAHEVQMYDQVAKIPGIQPGRTARYNQMVVRNWAESRAKALDAALMKSGNPDVPRSALRNATADALKEMTESPYLAGAEAENAANRVLTQFAKVWKEQPDRSVQSLLNARRQFDEILREQGRNFSFGERRGAVTEVARIFRTRINDAIDAAVPEAGVKRQLKEQHLALTARDILADKMTEEAPNALARIRHNVQNMHLIPSTALGAAATAAAVINSAPIAAVLASGATAMGTYRLGLGAYRQVRQLGADLLANYDRYLKLVEKGGKATADQLADLRADRAIVLDYLNSIEVASDEEE